MKINQRIHILGASWVGTTTLGNLLAKRLNITHFDTDEYFWIKTSIPYTEKREVNQRIELLKADLQKHQSWVLSGSLCGWGDFAIPMFSLVVFLWIPHGLRMERLRAREIERYGLEAISPGGWFYKNHEEFMAWAAQYDSPGTDIRKRELHEQWMSKLPCKVLRLEQPMPVQELAMEIEATLMTRRAEYGQGY
jgi:adenylate kinase family enzyme